MGSEEMPVKKGARQGDTISTMLFNSHLDWERLGASINGWEHLNNLFADYFFLFSSDGDYSQQMSEVLG